MSRRVKVSGCDCGAHGEGAHVVGCARAQDALRNMGAPAPRAAGRQGRRGPRAQPTASCGITFRSRLECQVFDELRTRVARAPGSALLRAPRFDLWRAWHAGMGVKPLCFTPDFLLVRPRGVLAARELDEVDDDVNATVGHVWTEKDLDLFEVEVHEAKTAKGLESRDYPVRLAAFRGEHPTWPIFEWRRPSGKKTGMTCERLADLSSASAPIGGA